MLFNSFHFLLFFPLVTIIYFLLPVGKRWMLLLLASCLFYMFFIPKYILILFFTIIIDYWAGIQLEKIKDNKKRKWFLIASLIANIGILVIFKYYNFINDNITYVLESIHLKNHVPVLNIILPIGLSFHTFQAMSYTIEVYRGNQKAERHFGIYSLYVMYYPQLVAGPIERPQNILPHMHFNYKPEHARIVSGLKQMLWGLFKKVVIADRLTQFVDIVYANPESFHGFPLIWATLFFAIQIYCDFSGYSDIALGASRVMGIELMQNFRMPYLSTSISEFWSRWHISLSTWFRDYLYIPLGGNRVAKYRWFFNMFFVFMVSGFWHGANFTYIIWGALHGAFLIFAIVKTDILKKINLPIRNNTAKQIMNFGNWAITFFLVCIAWIFFRASTVQDAYVILKNSLDVNFSNLIGVPNFTLPAVVFMFVLVLLVFVTDYILNKTKQAYLFQANSLAVNYIIVFMLSLCILLLGVFNNQNFIYFQF
jgi:alginate O-acetyltransferase complex protein AlgI